MANGSSDVMCIEHAWDALRRSIANCKFPMRTLQGLKTELLNEWVQLPQELINSFISGKKQDMLQLAEELGINATLNMTVPSIKIAITNSEGYEEEFVKNLYETIIANEKRLEELERAEKNEIGRVRKG
ncbi:hypothetical protein TNCV_3631141 [Trichonephila clavipes]|nr:hypothetical protein TNCV_3631141 [Trichonephila clavipes]